MTLEKVAYDPYAHHFPIPLGAKPFVLTLQSKHQTENWIYMTMIPEDEGGWLSEKQITTRLHQLIHEGSLDLGAWLKEKKLEFGGNPSSNERFTQALIRRAVNRWSGQIRRVVGEKTEAFKPEPALEDPLTSRKTEEEPKRRARAPRSAPKKDPAPPPPPAATPAPTPARPLDLGLF